MFPSYENIRQLEPPAFLESVRVKDLVENALQRAGLIKDTGPFLYRFPIIRELFLASAEEVLTTLLESNLSEDEAADVLGHLQRAMVFPDADKALADAISLCSVTVGSLPRNLDQILCGSNPGDVLDPVLLAFNVVSLADGDVDRALEHLVIHRCLMQAEDLVGNLHQSILGQAGGKQRVPEPRGKVKEGYDPETNPYPGIDVRLENQELYQLKNKTGSAKGGDGLRLGQQFRELGDIYPGCKRFYAAVLGTTLRGHRSKTGFLRGDPDAEVIVGLATIQQIGAYRDSPIVLLDLYCDAMEEAINRQGFDIGEVIATVQRKWHERFGADDRRTQLQSLLRMVIVGADPSELSSRQNQRDEADTNEASTQD